MRNREGYIGLMWTERVASPGMRNLILMLLIRSRNDVGFIYIYIYIYMCVCVCGWGGGILELKMWRTMKGK
jgi:hypothetical protein